LQKRDGNYILTVSDNGIGLPAGFDVGTAQSLGLKLVTFLSRHQLRAKIEVNSDHGTKFMITFKDKK
jgi:two-component sensor histidine kinase